MEAALDRCLVFCGFMGAGKTTSAAEAGRLLGVDVRDADALLEERLGAPIEDVFARDGEAAFRAAEERLVLELLDGPPCVIALGGGALGAPAVREALRDHVTVLLEVALETAWSRASGSGRPLARDRAAFDALYAEREAIYHAAADAVLPYSDLALLRRALGALAAMARGEAGGLRLLWATTASGDYPVWVGPGAGSGTAPWPLADASRRIVVTDANVAEQHAGRVPGLAGMIEIPPGEEHKTLATAERVWHALVAQEATRADHLVAVGGGVVGDLAGFCAATFQRGIPVVQVPTTLVAQVDSAYGGKTGVDLPE
nr:iron-containing alcohol dehydrogenase [Solirubrobacteraceae bacterium]